MSKEMRKYLDTFNEFFEKRKTMELIVSYDCSDLHKPFGDKLLELLKSDEYNGDEITMSNYKIGRMLTFLEIDILKEKILSLFSDAAQISEARREKRTIVKLITPMDTQFIIEEIISETE